MVSVSDIYPNDVGTGRQERHRDTVNHYSAMTRTQIALHTDAPGHVDDRAMHRRVRWHIMHDLQDTIMLVVANESTASASTTGVYESAGIPVRGQRLEANRHGDVPYRCRFRIRPGNAWRYRACTQYASP